MPELPEVEAVCRKLRRFGEGASIVEAKLLRTAIAAPASAAEFEARCVGSITRIERAGKNILIALDATRWLHVHLRMTGNLYVIPDARLLPLGVRAWFRFEDGRALIFEDSRALGRLRLLDSAGRAEVLASLGPEPLSRQFTVAALSLAASGSAMPVKPFLLNQRKVAGIGNIYAAEALFHARIHPAKKTSSLRPARIEALHRAIVTVLKAAVKSAVLAYSKPGQGFEAAEYELAVYDREGEPCRVCGRPIARLVQAGRSTYFCPRCQR